MEQPTQSATASIMDAMALYGPGPIPIEDDMIDQERPFPRMAAGLVSHLSDMFDGDALETHIPDLAWGMVNLFHRKCRKLEQDIGAQETQIKTLSAAQDGSEVKSVELEKATLKALALQDHLDEFEQMMDALMAEFRSVTGSSWKPKAGSRKAASSLTSAMIDARDFTKARRAREQDQLAPEGPIVAFSGGADWTDIEAIHKTLDKVHGRHPDMILAHTAQERGADLIASRWAEAKGVHQIACRPDFASHQKAAPFRRNDDMIALGLTGVVLFPGNGITANLGQKAEKSKIAVYRCGEAKTEKSDP